MPLPKARKEKGSGDLDPRSCLRVISEMTNSAGEPHRWDLSSGCPCRHTRRLMRNLINRYALNEHIPCTCKVAHIGRRCYLLNVTIINDNFIFFKRDLEV